MGILWIYLDLTKINEGTSLHQNTMQLSNEKEFTMYKDEISMTHC